jgi:hypothetical protein
MGKVLFRWTLDKLVKTIVATLLNRFDFFIVIEGGTGIGKSTLALRIAMKVRKEFQKLYALDEDTIRHYWENIYGVHNEPVDVFIEKIIALRDKKAYNFKLRNDMIYSQKAMIKFLSDWNRIGIPDEMINVTFNRDFFQSDQKDIIKLINMHRDHCNLVLACVPQFNSLDVQIKNQCKMRLSVVRRGLALIQTPNRTIHIKDKWDSATNEKIERDWLMKGDKTKPNYSKLTTARGLVRFSSLPKIIEAKYQKIKDDKRAKILKEDMGIDNEEKEKDLLDIAVEKLIGGGVRNAQILDGLAVAKGITPDNFKNQVRKKLQALNKPTSLSHYYWDRKAKDQNKATNEIEQEKEIESLIG